MDTVNDPEPNPELTLPERSLFAVAEALDAAGVPRTTHGEVMHGVELELDLAARVRWLTDQRDSNEIAREKEAREANRWAGEARQYLSEIEKTIAELASHGAPMTELMVYQGAEWVGRELAASRAAREEALKRADELSQRYNRAADELQALSETHQKVVSDAERWSKDSDRTIARLTTKIKKLESAGSGARFALTSEPRAAQHRADIVVDAESGKVVKNRLGLTTAGVTRAKPARAKPRTRKR